MPQDLELLFLFGRRENRYELRHGAFYEHVSLTPPPKSFVMPHIARSGKHVRLCYNLKCVELKQDADDIMQRVWAIRQAAVYHLFDVVEGKNLCIMTKGSLDLKQRTERATRRDGRARDRDYREVQTCFRPSLAIHLLLAYRSTESWRDYLQWMEAVVDKRVGPFYLNDAGS